MTALKKRHLKGASINIRCLKMIETYLKKKDYEINIIFSWLVLCIQKILRNIALKYFFEKPQASLEKAIAM